ncbi:MULTISPECIES: glycoside hydrolase family 3 protein [unclassified Novosphingobium]|uniref:glycoside hydrolase family 3 protein n=1 Tax=unclassified Novosphingobium TaxID=2644732 RepID=UPI000D2FE515|nr:MULTISPECIES: glycoside hydrolase family 3 protein [unclassified Novosphingobium]PTR10325.1 beta-glucosidase [Novosphingobium sp. GV055]PUB02996.1 beta-glucosidase [Novosphingobium sp. GV061]PUB19657.1 beta-glucosidase [Novosphingobium sp. GV079]PUB41296.1 beta-glucosidase [Novosphingobium sp. GV027]
MTLRRLLLAASGLMALTQPVLAADGPGAAQADRATAHPAQWPAAHSPAAITDPATEAQITALMARMTLAQKVGQMIQADISAITPADLQRYPLGSILAGGNSGPYGNERAGGADWARLVGEYRAASAKSGAGIPIIFGVDAVHGHSNLPGATIFPHNIGLGAMHDPALVQKIGAATAAEIAATGIEWTFAPTLAVPQDLRWGRSYEGYAADPALVAAYARAMVLGLQGPLHAGQAVDATHVAATAKHFLADGGTFEGKDQGDARITEAQLVATHAQGYPAAIDAGALTVMASFSSWNGVKNHGNRSLLTGVLKGRMGFGGFVVGDWNGHGQVEGCTVTACAASFNAGLDMAMAPDSWKGLFDSTLAQAQQGTISQARIDDAVRRILRVKFKLGLMGPAPVARGDAAGLGAPAHPAIAREAVAKSLVLLKNNGGLLPLKPGARVLVAGPGADSMAMQAGGWTITWQGTDTTAADFPHGQTIGRALADALGQAGGQATLAPDGQFTQKPDVAVVVYGEAPYAEFQGDVANLAFRPRNGEDALIARLKAQGIPVVSVFLSGRPLFAGPLINASDAFVAAWLPGTQGAGVADVLVAGRDGKPARDFAGTLPFPWPADARSPVTKPLFPAGFGLTYAHPAPLGRVNEDPRVDLSAAASDNLWFNRGQAPSPWHLGLDNAVTSRSIDLTAQEDARQFTWAAPGALAIDGPPVDLTRQADEGFEVRLDWRIDALPAGPIKVSVGTGSLDVASLLRLAPQGAVTQTRIPLRCFAQVGADLKKVGTPLRITAPQGFVVTLRNARVEATGSVAACPTQG